MTLPELSIKRHVLAWMLSAVLVLFGVISFDRIGMDRYPYIEFPVVSITTALKGANPDIVDASVTNIIESSVNSTGGSSSRGGGVKASATRSAPASGFCGSLSTRGVTGDICAINFSISPRRRQNNRKA